MECEAGPLKVDLLGPLVLHVGGVPVTLSAPKQRQVLAMLALNPGCIVTTPSLVEELWGDAPPRSYLTTLQTYVLHLRNVMTSANRGDRRAREWVGTRQSGYLLELQSCRTDVMAFHSHAAAGRAASETGDWALASERFGAALSLWRGPVLVDVRKGRTLAMEAASLQEARLAALERRIEADLALNRHFELLSELAQESARDPMNENLSAYFMTALYRAGHVSRALQVFQRSRTLLRSELGVDPGPKLQRLQTQILSGGHLAQSQ